MTEPEILEQLRPLLVEALGVSPERIRPESVLVTDLGAESIDLLDLSFRIEEHFHVTIEANEIEREVKRRLPGGIYEKDGVLTEEALAEIGRLAPELPQDKLLPGLRKNDLPTLLTVSFFVHLISRKLSQPTEGASHA
jgi:acyl carrier protein